jgi:hypothetical protein
VFEFGEVTFRLAAGRAAMARARFPKLQNCASRPNMLAIAVVSSVVNRK